MWRKLHKDNPKVADIMFNIIDDIENDDSKYKGQSILNIVENMKTTCVNKVVNDFCAVWHASKEDVMYAATHYRNGQIPNESAIKVTGNYNQYISVNESKVPKFIYYKRLIEELQNIRGRNKTSYGALNNKDDIGIMKPDVLYLSGVMI